MTIVIAFLDLFLIWALIVYVAWLWVVESKYRLSQLWDLNWLNLHSKKPAARAKLILFITALATVSTWFSTLLIKNYFYIPRPYLVNGLPTNIFKLPTDGSFPSSHTATAFAIATGIWLLNRRLGSVLFLIACLVGLLRVLGNVHYPIDILGGAFLGSAATTFLYIIVFQAKKHPPRLFDRSQGTN